MVGNLERASTEKYGKEEMGSHKNGEKMGMSF